MRKPMTSAEVRRLVKRAMDNDQKTMAMTEEDKDHPQVADIHRKLKGRIEAWEAVLTAFQGNDALLRLMAE